MTRKEQLSLINKAYAELGALQLQDGFYDVRYRLFDMNEAAERQHRKGAPNGMTHGISVKMAAKLFTVSHLLDGWANPDKWDVSAILNIRTEVLYAQAYAKRHYATLADWAKAYTEPFAQVDYAELMKVGR